MTAPIFLALILAIVAIILNSDYRQNVVKAAWNIFGDSYRYRAAYNEYKAKRMGRKN